MLAGGHALGQCLEVGTLTAGGTHALAEGSCVRAQLANDGRFTYEFDLQLVTPGHVHDLVLQASGATDVTLCVRVNDARSCREASADGVRYHDLWLAPATARVHVALRGSAGQSLQLAFEDRGAPQPGFAYEPNDTVATAWQLAADFTLRGRFQGREVDVISVDIDGDPQLWRVQVQGATVEQLDVLAASGRSEQQRRPAAGDRGVRLSNLYLLPGRHYLSVRGSDGDYALRMIPLGPAEDAASASSSAPATLPSTLGTPTEPRVSAAAASLPIDRPSGPRPLGQMEREPNDHDRTASLLRPDEPWVGLLSDPGDVDTFRFYLGQDGPARLTVIPPGELALVVRVDGEREQLEPGESFVLERWFHAGDHVITIAAANPVDGYYQLRYEHIDPFVRGDLPRPHNEPWHAQPLPAHHEIHAQLERYAYIRLPVLPAATRLVVEILTGPEQLRVFGVYTPSGSRLASFVHHREERTFTAELTPGGPYLVRIDGGGEAHLRFHFDANGPTAAPLRPPPALSMTLHGLSDVAAYHPQAQQRELALELRNEGREPLDLQLESHTSDAGWQLIPRVAHISLPAGHASRVPIDVYVAPVARDDLPVTITLGARRADGHITTLAARASAICGLTAVDPTPAFALPEALLGGLNVAWSHLGAEVVTPTSNREQQLYDGLTPPAGGWRAGIGEHTTVQLVGESPPRVVGVVLHPLSSPAVAERLADFEIHTSLDGIHFLLAYRGRLSAVNHEQGFVFPAPIEARYARLVLLSNQDGSPRDPALGTFKVIAEPGSGVLGERLDLGLRTHGGHVAAALPYLASYELNSDSGRSRPHELRLAAGVDTVWWVHAFHHNRAALIDTLVWHSHPQVAVASGVPIDAVTVSVSLESPLGPWTELGDWHVGATPEWSLEVPVWARFVRFEANFSQLDRPTIIFPERVGLLEQPESRGYRSVLGEWGHYARAGVWEWQHLATTAAIIASDGRHSHRDRALPLAAGETSAARVLVGEFDAYFSFEVTAGNTFVQLQLRGESSIDYRYALHNAAGDPLRVQLRESIDQVTLEAYLEPGRYYLHAWEPLRQVVFSWDDSGSMGPYADATIQTVLGFAREVNASRELVQLQVFAGNPTFLLADWTSAPHEVLRGMLAYPRDEGSSDLEGNLAYAVAQLNQRDGTRALMLVTDAESSPGALTVTPLWEALLETPVKLFAFETSSAASDHTQDRMQTYADVAGGFYDYARTLGDLDVGFARASCLLRQPKLVQVALRVEARDPPGPGALALLSPPQSTVGNATQPAVHVIYDASGSMGQLLLDGSASRHAVARRTLTALVEEILEPGTPFALRAYGHLAPMSCDSALVYPLAPLERAAARAAIERVEPKLLSGTPLAATIAALASDLRGSTGPKTVILLTDGEESCGGDPEAAIRALRLHDDDVRLSIVGFDVVSDDDATMRSNFAAWAELGGGVFLEAETAGQLRAALQIAAVQRGLARFEVVDAAGVVIASGVVDGEPVPLKAGRYQLRIIGGASRIIEGVEVLHERTTTLILDEE